MKIKNILIILLISLVLIFMGQNISQAAYNAGDKTVNSGESFSVTVTSTTPLDSYNLSLSSYTGLTFSACSKTEEGAVISINGGNIGYMNASGTTTSLGTYSFKAPTVTKDTTYTIIFAEAISGVSNIKSTITVKAPPTPTPTPTSAPATSTPTTVPSTPTPAPTATATPAPVKSSNSNLANLGIEPNDFSGFKSGTTDYYVTVPNEVSSINVYAKKAEEVQTISGTGNKSLEVGTNKCSVTVTAEDGTQKTYNIYVTRKVEETETVPNVVEEPEEILKLSSLEVKNATITPSFTPDVYEYEVELADATIEKLDILATANIENASIEVTGNENFMEGENTVTIVLKSEDGTKAATYTITVTKGAATIAENETIEPIAEEKEQEPVQEEKKSVFSFLKSGNTGMIVILVIAVIVLLASIITVVVILVRNRKDSEAEMMSFTPNSEYNVFEEKVEDKKEKVETEEKSDREKRRGKHF